MTMCSKKAFNTQAEAQAKLDLIIEEHKRTGKGGKSWQRLNVFRCKLCSMWHHGRANNCHHHPAAPKPVKQPTPGQQRRAEKRAAEKAAKQKMYADYTDNLRICQILIDRELARYAALGIKPRAIGHGNERQAAFKA